MNKKGQALVEFVIILPVMLILVFALIDFGRVINLNSELDNKISDVVMLYQGGKTTDEIKKIITDSDDEIEFDFKVKEDYVTLTISKSIKPITPGFNYIPKKVFDVSASRVIKNE